MNEVVTMSTNEQWSSKNLSGDVLEEKGLSACLPHCGDASLTFSWSRVSVVLVNILQTFTLEFIKKRGNELWGHKLVCTAPLFSDTEAP